MRTFAKLSELEPLVGEHIADSDWIEVTQERIQLFADATNDHQWIHVDPERARAGPFGTTDRPRLHDLVPAAARWALRRCRSCDTRMGVNYGLNRVRFPAPVPTGSRVRGRFKLLKYEPIDGGAQLTFEVLMEREGSDKPVCVAESVGRRFV